MGGARVHRPSSPALGFASFLSTALILTSLIVCFYLKDFIIAFLTLPTDTLLSLCTGHIKSEIVWVRTSK